MAEFPAACSEVGKVLIYDVTVKLKQDVSHKSAEVAVRREGDAWKVVFYKLSDG